MDKVRNIYVRGDVHGNFGFLPYWCEQNKTTKEDILIILGDSGLNYFLDGRFDGLKKKISKLPITLFCVRGNHEARPEDVKGMKCAFIKEISGFVCYQPKYDNIYYALDGGVYIINDKTFLTIGGAYSVDKFYRLEKGYNWFENEQLSFDEQNFLFNLLKGSKVDYVLTHTCPIQWEPRELFLDMIDESTVDKNTELWLRDLEKEIEYEYWFFGHYHGSKDIYHDGKVLMLYEDIIQICP